MKNAHMRWGLGAALILVTGSLAMATTTQASAASPPNACGSQIQAKARAEGFGGVVPAIGKHVESCFFAGSRTTAANACTINYQPSAAYCAYHNEANSSAIYANMPYPIYLSKVGFTCGTEKNFGAGSVRRSGRGSGSNPGTAPRLWLAPETIPEAAQDVEVGHDLGLRLRPGARYPAGQGCQELACTNNK